METKFETYYTNAIFVYPNQSSFLKKVKVLVFSLNLGVQLSNVSEMSSSSFICVTDAAISI